MGTRILLRDAFSAPTTAMTRATEKFKSTLDQGRQSLDRFTARTAAGSGPLRRFMDGVTSVQGAIASLAAAASIKVGYDWMIGANANMETYKNTLTVVLESEQRAIETLAWAEKFAASTPFEIPQIVEATTRMAAYGINAQKTLGLVGDMASVMGKPLMQAVEAVADAQTGELERLKEFGITKKMIEQQAKLMGTSPINNQGSITDQKAFNAALFSLMEKRYKGGMEMQSKTFKGMLSNASDFIGSIGRQLGKPLFDKATQSLANTLAKIQELKDSGKIDLWVSNIQTGATKIYNNLKPVFTIIGAIGGAALATAGFIVDHWNLIGPIVEGLVVTWGAFYAGTLAARAGLLLWTAAQWLLNTAMTANPIGLVITGISLLIGMSILLANNWDLIKTKASALWEGITNAFKAGVNAILPMVNKVIDVLNKIPGINIPKIEALQIGKPTDMGALRESERGALTGTGGLRVAETFTVAGSHAGGLDRVPYDGYIAELHKGERVLTADETRALDSAATTNNTSVRTVNVEKITEQIVIQGTSSSNPKQMAALVMAELYELLEGAGEILGSASKEVLLW